MTEYVILRETEPGSYEVVKAVSARSAAAAIVQAVGENGNGHYVATPERSWRPVTVSIETKRQVKLTSAGSE